MTKLYLIEVKNRTTRETKFVNKDEGYPFVCSYPELFFGEGLGISLYEELIGVDQEIADMVGVSGNSKALPRLMRIAGEISNECGHAVLEVSLYEYDITAHKATKLRDNIVKLFETKEKTAFVVS